MGPAVKACTFQFYTKLFYTHIAGHEHLAEVPILVLANKKDLRDAMTASELTTALALTDVKVRWHRCHARALDVCSASSRHLGTSKDCI